VATINRAAAERYWPSVDSPGEDALGQRFLFHGDAEERLVVGIVADAKVVTIGEDPQPQIFLPVAQEYSPAITLLARVEGPPEAMLETLRREVQLVDPALAVGNLQTMADAIDVALWAPRTTARLLGAMGGLALALAAVGIYGVMSYTVSRRRREIAVRMALGASRGAVARLVLGQGLALLAGGLAIGLAVAVLLGRRLEGLLYGVRVTDATTLLATAAVLATVAILANLLPTRRATAVDPVRVLRAER
jgi:putative ABC transport system permease protein